MRKVAIALVCAALCGAAYSQHSFPESPCAGFQRRAVKALSDAEFADLRAGRGMGIAPAAEMNGLPGRAHVIELSDKIGRSEAQLLKVRELFASMKDETVAIGMRLIAQGTVLDEQFASKTIGAESLAEATKSIGETQEALRLGHLKFHLAMADILSPAQTERYKAPRGYSNGAHHHPTHSRAQRRDDL